MTCKSMNLLAIGHEASLTGAPLLLLSYLTAICSKNSFHQVRIILGSGGALAENYKEIADTFVADEDYPIHRIDRIVSKLTNKYRGYNKEDEQLLRWIEGGLAPDIIYVNTVASIPLLSRLLPLFSKAPKIVIHVHELDWLLQKYEAEYGIGLLLRSATKVIAPCNSVAQSLNKFLKVPLDLIHIIPEWICRDINVEQYEGMRPHVRHELGLKETDTLCIGVGKMQWRKGSDLVPLIASKCNIIGTSIHFAWIGGSTADELLQFKLDVKKAGIDRYIHLIPEQVDPYPYFSAGDVYMLPSREDPYPVSMLEAGLFQLPVVCFDQSGGASEYISNGSGISVPFLDIDGFASAVHRISKAPNESEKMGRVARAAVLESHNIFACEQLITKTLISTSESSV